ncbi:hypothetical protein F441_03097 [Phytophthora nicotianae CJ01A1]|uniref:Uncharacterized protein n=1 Tax=Phytophthora nicotianae CJ01A1 TaxID=1317063 RepID=W2XPF8_PHYNI|nr:hypothetical protein F441_03097 [Phytophthora nicotianae CJ01A1]
MQMGALNRVGDAKRPIPTHQWVQLASRIIAIIDTKQNILGTPLIGNHEHVVVKSYKLTRGYNIAAILALVVLTMLVLGMWIENNDSSLMGIPKRDFMEVFTNILNSDAPNPATPGPAQVHQLPGKPTIPTRQRKHFVNDDEEVASKRDSFYFLVRGMRARTLAAREKS